MTCLRQHTNSNLLSTSLWVAWTFLPKFIISSALCHLYLISIHSIFPVTFFAFMLSPFTSDRGIIITTLVNIVRHGCSPSCAATLEANCIYSSTYLVSSVFIMLDRVVFFSSILFHMNIYSICLNSTLWHILLIQISKILLPAFLLFTFISNHVITFIFNSIYAALGPLHPLPKWFL